MHSVSRYKATARNTTVEPKKALASMKVSVLLEGLVFPEVCDRKTQGIYRYGRVRHVFLDGDWEDEIVLGGVNDLYHRAFVATIRPTIKRSISPVPAGYAPSFVVGQEIGYLLFPKTDVADAEGRSCRGVLLRRVDQNQLTDSLQPPIAGTADIVERVYVLDRNFNTTQLTPSEAFLSLHRQLRLERRLDHDWSGAERKKLMKLERLVSPPAK
jgi:hypothetical protein